MWDSVINRAPVKLPELKTKPNNEQELAKLLTPIDDMKLPCDDSDCGSEIPDIFEEFHKNSFLRPLPGTKNKFLNKIDADWKTVDQFTDDFKKTMKEMRLTLKIDETMTTENETTIEKELLHPEKRPFFFNKKKLIEEPINIGSECESETTSNSAVWNMIKAHRKEYFATSPLHYDIYKEKPAHYLKRPDVPYDEIENSRKKCEKWLDDCE